MLLPQEMLQAQEIPPEEQLEEQAMSEELENISEEEAISLVCDESEIDSDSEYSDSEYGDHYYLPSDRHWSEDDSDRYDDEDF